MEKEKEIGIEVQKLIIESKKAGKRNKDLAAEFHLAPNAI